MQLRKFYGRTVSAALARVKRELGPDALILETILLTPENPAVRLHPDARYEILAARDTREGKPAAPMASSAPAAQAIHAYQGNQGNRGYQGNQGYEQPKPPRTNLSDQSDRTDRSDGMGRAEREERTEPFVRAAGSLPELKRGSVNAPKPGAVSGNRNVAGVDYEHEQEHEHELNKLLKGLTPNPRRGKDVLEDLGLLRSQLSDLLGGDLGNHAIDSARLDLGDYHGLIALGVEHDVLAPHFRAWLEWRTAPPAHRRWIAQLQSGPAARMQGESLREWLWLIWTGQLGMGPAQSATRASQAPQVTALLGTTGSGKTTTLAKLASIKCHQYRQNAVILTLDTFRFGATEQWRRMARLMGIEVEEIVSQADISRSMERWDRYDWIGIDTPGGLTPDSAAGILYGSILAHYRDVESVVVLPATQRESVSREQMKRYRGMGVRKALFSKMDESMHNGSILNLTIDGKWNIDGFATGCRIPEDWERATPETLWRRILAPQVELGGAA